MGLRVLADRVDICGVLQRKKDAPARHCSSEAVSRSGTWAVTLRAGDIRTAVHGVRGGSIMDTWAVDGCVVKGA